MFTSTRKSTFFRKLAFVQLTNQHDSVCAQYRQTLDMVGGAKVEYWQTIENTNKNKGNDSNEIKNND